MLTADSYRLYLLEYKTALTSTRIVVLADRARRAIDDAWVAGSKYAVRIQTPTVNRPAIDKRTSVECSHLHLLRARQYFAARVLAFVEGRADVNRRPFARRRPDPIKTDLCRGSAKSAC